jgi:hypothetical protein
LEDRVGLNTQLPTQQMNPIMSLLPNDIIMNIIQIADGGLHTHKKNMKTIFRQVINMEAVFWYEDGCIPPNNCPMYWSEVAVGCDEGWTDSEDED